MAAIYSAVVAAPAAFPAVDAPSVEVPFPPRKVTIINLDGTLANYVEVSFQGGTSGAVAGRLVPTIYPAHTFEPGGTTKIYLRRGAGTPNVQVIAEA